jgi:hypothetical protein
MTLRLIGAPEPDSLPTGGLLARDLCRPGELHEVVALDERTGAVAAAKAARAGVSADVAVTLLVELELLYDDLARAGLAGGKAPAFAPPSRRLSAAEADYLRFLAFPRRSRSPQPVLQVALPVRLLPRMTRDLLARAVDGDLERAIQWEVAALTAGRTIGEFGLLLARERRGTTG